MEGLGPGGAAGTGVESGATAANGFSWTGLDAQAAAMRSTAATVAIVLKLILRMSSGELDVGLSRYRFRSVAGTHLFIAPGASPGRTWANGAGAASLARPRPFPYTGSRRWHLSNRGRG